MRPETLLGAALGLLRFYDEDFLYCSLCPKRVEVSRYDERARRIRKLLPEPTKDTLKDWILKYFSLIEENLAPCELFGHEKGAFTGALAPKPGRFELAHTGTLFLDEIGDIPLGLQPKLLRVLQEQEFERLGSGKTHQVDFRLVAATHRNLEQMMKRNEFRSDLYYRLNVFPIELPPLRARRDDIPALIAHFVGVYGRRIGKCIERIPQETICEMVSYSWPGNVRELQNLIERAVILSEDGVLANPLERVRAEAPTRSGRAVTLKDVTRALILQALEVAGWQVGGPTGAAAKLGLNRTTLISKMKKLGISRPASENNVDSLGEQAQETDVIATTR